MVNTSNYEFLWLGMPLIVIAGLVSLTLLLGGGSFVLVVAPIGFVGAGLALTAMLEYLGDGTFIKDGSEKEPEPAGVADQNRLE